ncbi:MAG: choline kinase family protein [Rubrobacteraceae bacterium]
MSLENADPALRAVVAARPEWAEAENVEAEYISGGITNQNYYLRVDGTPYFVRLAGEKTELLGIDRDNERQAVEAAASVGIGPDVVDFLPEHGCLITEWIDGDPVSPEEVRRRDVLERLVSSIAAYHEYPGVPGSFSPFRIVEEYRESAEDSGVETPDAYWELLERSREIEEAFRRHPVPERPCHNDLLDANFLMHDDRVMIIDYEYAGMGDVFFDLGNLSVNNEFDEEADLALLEMYFGEEPTSARIARLKLMRLMSDFREAMWGVMQQAISSLDFDYEEYADKHFDRCRELAKDERYSEWLREAAAEPA